LEVQDTDGIRMDLTEIGWGNVKWIHLAQNRDRWSALVNMVMNLRILVPRSLLMTYNEPDDGPTGLKYVVLSDKT
jgi:hypothetical protein